MSRQRDPDVTEMALTVDKMFEAGITDPNIEEILVYHFNGLHLPRQSVEIYRKRLHKVRAVLESDYKRATCLLSSTYYDYFRNVAPPDRGAARRCIPQGNGKRAEGLRLHSGYSDLIWEASVEAGLSTGAGKVKTATNRVVKAVENGQLGKPQAANMLQNAETRSQPDNSAMAQSIMESLQGVVPQLPSGENTEEESRDPRN